MASQEQRRRADTAAHEARHCIAHLALDPYGLIEVATLEPHRIDYRVSLPAGLVCSGLVLHRWRGKLEKFAELSEVDQLTIAAAGSLNLFEVGDRSLVEQRLRHRVSFGTWAAAVLRGQLIAMVNRDAIAAVAQALLRQGTLCHTDIVRVIGRRGVLRPHLP